MTHNHTIPPDLYVIPYLGSFNDAICSDMDVVSDLHRIVVEVAAVSLVWRSVRSQQISCASCQTESRCEPHYTPFTNQAVPPERNDDRMTRPSTSQVPSNNGASPDYRLTTQYNVLGTGDGSSARDFVASVLM